MSEEGRSVPAEQLQALCQEVGTLVKSLPGSLRRLVVRTTDHTVELEWSLGDSALMPGGSAEPSIQASAESADAAAYVVRAPLVGTFYRAPQPDADPFVCVNDIVEVGQTVAILEAMKLLNHVITDTAGRVVEIYVGDGEPVEFEQPLLRIQPLTDDQAA